MSFMYELRGKKDAILINYTIDIAHTHYAQFRVNIYT